MIVVDTSVALAWVLNESQERQRYAASVIQAKIDSREELIAPPLMLQEVAHKLLKKGRYEQWGEAKIAEYGEVIDDAGVRLLDVSSAVAAHIRFCIRWNVQGFDAVFLGLALATQSKLATLDGGMRTAAKAAGIPLFGVNETA